MCDTELNLDDSGFYALTGRLNWFGPFGNCGTNHMH